MFYSEGQHLRAFLGFCGHNGLVAYLKKHQWTSFARAYNGPSYADHAYDVQMPAVRPWPRRGSPSPPCGSPPSRL